MSDEATGRIAPIDGLRGLAVMGILLMNVAGFAMPSGGYFNPWAWSVPSRADLAVWAANFVLIDGKMRALFSILFGASMLIVMRGAEAAGTSALRRHLARMAVLAGFGAVHLVLIWPGDILLQYAIIGLFAYPFTALEPRQQIKIAAMLLLLQLLFGAIFLAGFVETHALATAPGASRIAVEGWRAFSEGVGIGRPQDVLADIAQHRGGWWPLVQQNWQSEARSPLFVLMFDGPETLAFMLIGMAALGSGFLAGTWPRARYVRVAAIGYAIALPPSIALCWLCFHVRFDTITTFTAATFGGIVLRPIMALADAALGILWLTSGTGPLRARVIAAGRCAFTNYLGSSIVMTAIFYGWGLGLFARLGRAELLPVVLGAWALMLAWSAPWLASYRYGPLEWLWRSLARGKLQPMRRNAIATVLH
ncbi:MAG: hypothetical protein JWO65_2454 [Sphingomonas bacterium]|nr:hypothetical protein [Sphingomonas bacterium]